MGTLLQDLRYGFRALRRSPGFTIVAVLSLALGIGANTAIFSLIEVLLLRKPPVDKPEQIVFFRRVLERGGASGWLPYPFFEQIRDHGEPFSGIFASGAVVANASIDDQTESVATAFVSGAYFSVLRVNAILGRTLGVDDDQPGRPPVVVLEYDYWKRRFALDPDVIGKTIRLNRVPFTIVGVMPEGFCGLQVDCRSGGLWIPLAAGRPFAPKEAEDSVGIYGRLEPGLSIAQARAEMTVIYSRFLKRTSRKIESIDLLSPFSSNVGRTREYAERLRILMPAVGLVLLIACANLANLLLARAVGRQREIAMRIALGAGRCHLIRQLLTESVMLAALGGALGLLFTWWGSDILFTVMAGRPTTVNLHPDLRILGFTALLSMTTGILFGLAPALRATRIDLYPALKEGGRRATVGPGQNRVRNSLVTAQVALSMVLVIGAGLLIRTLRNLDQVDLGFNREHVLLAEVYPLTLGYEGVKEIALYKQLLQEIRAIPGVRCASLSRIRLTEGHSKRVIMVQDRSTQGVEAMEVSWNAVAPRFFETMQIPLLAGRDFSDADTERAERVVVINQALARLRFPGQNPIGKRIRFREEESSGEIEIIGVVRDTRAITVRKYDTTGEVYVPFAQSPRSTRDRFTLAIHAAGSPLGIVASLRQAVRTVDPDLALVDIGTQKETMSRSFRAENALARLTGIFGALALLLASIGLYGTMSYMVARRTNEIGIRMALGALRGHVVWLVLVENLKLVIAGVAVGIPAALAASRLISSLLFGVVPADALTISSAVLIMAAVAAAAGYLPLLRASRVDPIIALRCE